MEFVNDVVAVANDARAGRGVRLRRAVRAGEVIERCPVLVLPTDQWEQFDDTVFYGYFYAWDDDTVAFALGYGSLYNHSRTPNAEYYADFDGHCVEIVSLVDLDAGTEVLIDYTRGGTNPLWFEPLDEPAPSPQQLDVAV